MSRYWLAFVLIAASLLVGCGGGLSTSSPTPGKGAAVPGQLVLSLSPSNFGSVAVGSSSVKSGTLTAGSSSVTISSGSGSGSGFSISGISYPVTLAAGQSLAFTVTFAPQATGSVADSITFVSNASNSPTSVALTGTGTAGAGGSTAGQLSLSLSPSNFGNVTVGSNSAKTGTLTAGASASVTVSSASWKGTGFSVSGITFPVTIGAGQNLPFTVTFAPQAGGAVSGSISFLSSAANSPTSEAVTGTGIGGTVTHSVSLSWTPSPSEVIGYNVYRGTAPGGPYPSKLTPTPQSTTTLVDNTVVGGTTYYYVATSVDNNSVESVYSDQIVAAVP
jgi:Abnormal spindle-like microcephaly-assoc'd, ASPM-SPD-2-Hydin